MKCAPWVAIDFRVAISYSYSNTHNSTKVCRLNAFSEMVSLHFQMHNTHEHTMKSIDIVYIRLLLLFHFLSSVLVAFSSVLQVKLMMSEYHLGSSFMVTKTKL